MKTVRNSFASSLAFICLVTASNAFGQVAVRPARVPTAADLVSIMRGFDQINKETINGLRSEANAAKGGSPLDAGNKLLRLGTGLHQFEEASWLVRLTQYEAQTTPAKLARPELNFGGSTKEFAAAKAAFDQLYRGKTKWKPIGLLNYGYTLAITKEPLAVNVLDRLITKFAKSKLTQEGSLVLAHFYFDSGDMERTQRELNNVTGSGSLFAYRAYMQAWMEFLKQRQNKNTPPEKLVAPFMALLEKYKDDDSAIVKRITGRVLGDVVGLIADVGNATVAKSMLMKVEQPAAYRVVAERIAQRKLNENSLEAAYGIYKNLIKEFPSDKRNPQLMVNAIDIAASQNNVQRIVQDCNTMVNDYVEESAAWFDANDESDLAKAEGLAKNTIYRYAIEMDRLFRANPRADKRLKAGSNGLYNLFVTKFPKDRRTAEIKLNLVKSLYDDKNYARAGKQASEILEKHKKFPQLKDAGDLLLASTQTLYDAERVRIKLPAPGKAKNPIPMPDSARAYVAGLDLYMKSFPKNENADAIIFAGASVFYDFGDYDEAGTRVDRLVTEYPNSDFGIKAAYLMIGYYLLIKDQELLSEFQGLCAKSQKLASHPEIAPLLKRKIQTAVAPAPALVKDTPAKPVVAKELPKKASSEESEEDDSNDEESD